MDDATDRPLALVTGGSSGIGLELAKQFLDHGYDVLVDAEDDGARTAAEGELQGRGGAVGWVRADLRTFDGVEAVVDAVQATGRPLDAVAVNAGVGRGGAFVDSDLQAQLDVVNLNVTSAVHLTRRLLPGMVERDTGKVLFTSSIAALMPGPFESVYAASKAFLLSFSEALREELKDTGVTVTALLPGPTDTNFFHRAGMDDTRAGTTSMKSDPAKVAAAGFAALMKDKDKVVAGVANKAQAAGMNAMTEPQKAKAHRVLSEPGSGS